MQNNSVSAEELKQKQVKNRKESIENASARLFDDALDKDEKILSSFSASRKAIFFTNLFKPLLIFFAFALVVLFLHLSSNDILNKKDSLICMAFIFGLTIVIEIIAFFITKKYLKYAYYIVTNKRVIISQGVFQVDYKFLDLNNVKDVELKWSFINKLFGKKVGQIYFYPSEKCGKEIVFHSLENVLESYIEIENILEEFNGKNNK